MSHINYYIDLYVDTFVVHNHAVLLCPHEKYDYWGAPGGHVEPGEDINQAALWEVWEEVGLVVELVGPSGWIKRDSEHNQDLVPPVFVNRHKITDTHDHSACIFVAKTKNREITPQLDEDIVSSATCLWLTKHDLDELKAKDARFGNDTYRYATEALRLVN